MIQRNVHHQGKRPTRTCLAAPVLNPHTGKWSASFETWASPEEGDDYMVASCTSGAHFDTAELATEAGHRALDVLQETGRYPNMCEIW